MKAAELATFELYNLRSDVGETTDRAKSNPEIVEKLSGTLRRGYREVRDESPIWPPWTWPRIEGKRIREHRKTHHLP